MPDDNNDTQSSGNKSLHDIIIRIQKLQALAKNNANLNEMKAATSAAEKLISLHRITQAQLEAEHILPTESFKTEVVLVQGRRTAWIERLLQHLCTHFGGSFFLHSQRNEDNKCVCIYTVVARESDWTIIHYFINYLWYEVDKLAKMNCRGMGIAESNSFRMGCSDGIGSLIADLRAETRKQAVNSTAMVLLDKRAEEARAHMYSTNSIRNVSSVAGGTKAEARARGYEKGRTVSINKPLKA